MEGSTSCSMSFYTVVLSKDEQCLDKWFRIIVPHMFAKY